MVLLGIETSCDETAAAVVSLANNQLTIHGQIVASQAKLHAKYGGIVPEVAARKQVETIIPILKETNIDPKKINAIAVTSGPGLVTSLGVGVETAKVLSLIWQKPLIAINHVLAHLYGAWLSNPPLVKDEKKFLPALGLIVSGGHTELIIIKNHQSYKLLGRTLDDAAGEALDKSARLLGLPYPGGAALEKLAKASRAHMIKLPRMLVNNHSFNFSYSGLKTAVRYEVEKGRLTKTHRAALAAAAQTAVVELITRRVHQALKKIPVKSVIIGGGVTANKYLCDELQNIAQQHRLPLFLPHKQYTGDNAAMIAAAGLYQLQHKNTAQLKKYLTTWKNLSADPNWELC